MSAAKRGGTMGTNWSRRGRGARRGSRCACRDGTGPGKAVGVAAPRLARRRSGGGRGKRSRRGPVSGFEARNDGVSIQLLLFSQLPDSHLPTWWRKGKEGEGLGGVKRNTEARISFPKEWRANISGKKQAWHTVLRASHKFRTVSVR